MRSILLLVAVCFVALAAAQPDTVLELISGNADFQVRYHANSLPRWLLNDKTYYILGSLPCSFGENPIWNGTDWYCGNFTGFPVGSALVDKLGCSAGQDIAFNGTNFICSSDSDLLASLNCSVGDIPVKEGNTFVCGQDSDLLATITCAEGDILVFNGTAFQCTAQVDIDTLKDLNCSSGQTVKRYNGVWQCADDLDYFSFLNCSAGQVAKYESGTFVCGVDNDLLATLGCVAGDTIIGNSTYDFECVPEPTPPGVPVSFIDGQTLTPSTGSLPATFQTYFGSPIGRDLNSIQLISGLQVIALSYNFNQVPPQGFTFSILIFKRIGTASSLVDTIVYPSNSNITTQSVSLDYLYSNQEQLYVQYLYNGITDSTLSVTTVLFIRHFVF